MKPFHRPTYARIDLDALSYNISSLQKIHRTTLIAVIKANAYGHGDEMVAKHLESLGVKFFAVATLDEALNLRLKGVTNDILIMGVVAVEDIPMCVEQNLICAALTQTWIESLPEVVQGLRVHLKVNTGLNRYGVEVEEAKISLQMLDHKGALTQGIFTHFASSDDPDSPQTKTQYDLFVGLLDQLGRDFTWVHSANSGAAVNFPTPRCNAVRIGLSLYGYSDYPIDLKPVLSLMTTLQEVKRVKAHQPIGYNATYVTKQDEWIGTLCIGYADGLFRHHQGSVAYIDGSYCEYVGRISMDLTIVRLDKAYPIGTPVEILGPHLDIHKIAKHLGTIPYELLAMITDRVPRVYIKDGIQVGVLNARYPSSTIIR